MRLPRGIRRLFRLEAFRLDLRGEVDAEIDSHFEHAVDALERSGFNRQAAEREARRRFGNERAYRDALNRIDMGRVRMRERSEVMDVAMRTVQHALRGVRRAPGYSVAVITILALGIGANAVMFGVVDRLLLSPPQHVQDWEQVRHLYVRRTIFNGEIRTNRPFTFPDFQDFRQVAGWSSVAAYGEGQVLTMGRGADAVRVRSVDASASIFTLLGAQPALGRFFTEEEDAPGVEPTVVLAYEFWERRFGADESVLGRVLDIGRGRFTVVGVAPPGFTGAELQPVDVWLPLQTSYALSQGTTEWADHRGWWFVRTVARLASGATDDATLAQATALHVGGRADRIANDSYDPDARIVAAPIIAARGPDPSAEAKVARWLAGVSLIVLLIACFNVANLMLARGIRARREVAVRLALGVSRGRLFGQVLAESAVLAGVGAAAALLVARSAGSALHQVLLPNVAFEDAAAIGARLVVFTIGAAVIAALLAAVIPGLQAARPDVADTLRTSGRGVAGGGSRLRTTLLVAQAALSVFLLVGAGLFVGSLGNAQALDLGYDAERVGVVGLEWNETLPGSERQAIYADLLERVRRLPGVTNAGFTYTLPFWSSIGVGQPAVPGRDSIPRHMGGGPYLNKVSAGFFEAMSLEIVAGRPFSEADGEEGAQPVAILTESMASAIWPDDQAVGQCLLLGDGVEAGGPCTTVVGVVENHRRQELVEDDHFMYFVNQSHPEFVGPPQQLVVGTFGPATALLDDLRTEAMSSSPLVRFARVTQMQELIDPSIRSWRLGATMFTVFGLLALLVAAWGLYSVLAFDVAVRRHELGVRSALGAGVSRIVRLVLGQAVALVALGVAIGLASAYGAAGFVEDLLFEMSPRDPAVYGAVAAVLLGVALLAGTLPALRAVRVDPTEALRAD